MTSLHPGLLFYSTGLNKKSTPNGPEASPSEIDRKLGRAPFNGRPWPRPSPVSSVYDVRNSSTRMIILNNKLSRRAKGSRLRGQTDNNGEIQAPEPERHLSDTKPHTNWEHHKQCAVSVSEKFMPIPAPTATNNMPEWVNKTQRPAMKFDNGSGVNPNHHIQCQGHMDYDIIRWYNAQAHSRRVGGGGQSRSSSRADGGSKGGRTLSPILNGPGLSRGERRYLNSIAKIYSVDNMRQQVQVQYNRLMWKEISKGCYKDGEWEKYQRYLNTPRKTQFGPCDPFREKRSVSAPGINNQDDSRPYTSQTSQRSTARRPASRNLTAPAGATRKGKGGGKARPVARKESPLPPPQQMKGSASSLSSLEEEEESKKQAKNESIDKQQRSSESEEKPTKPTSSSKELSKADGDSGNKLKEDDSTTRATANIGVEEEEDEKNKSGDAERVGDGDDERSKLSARGPSGEEEQRGGALEYRTTVGERQDERETLSDRDTYRSNKPGPVATQEKSSPKQEEQRDTRPYGEMTEKSTTGPREERPTSGSDSKPSQASNEDGGGEDATKEKKQESRPASSHYSKAESEIYVPIQKTSDSSSVSATAAANQQDDAELLPQSHHKEGKDRPLSRLGGREQFMVVKPDRENSDDDYSDDDGDGSISRNKPAASVQESQKSEQKDANQDGAVDANVSQAQVSSSSAAAAPPAEPGAGSKPDDYREHASTGEASTQEKPSDISTVEY